MFNCTLIRTVGVHQKKLLNIEETPKFFDSTDALAIALCHCMKLGNSNKKSPNNWAQFAKENPDRVK